MAVKYGSPERVKVQEGRLHLDENVQIFILCLFCLCYFHRIYFVYLYKQ